jgi:hypothetical protein
MKKIRLLLMLLTLTYRFTIQGIHNVLAVHPAVQLLRV